MGLGCFKIYYWEGIICVSVNEGSVFVQEKVHRVWSFRCWDFPRLYKFISFFGLLLCNCQQYLANLVVVVGFGLGLPESKDICFGASGESAWVCVFPQEIVAGRKNSTEQMLCCLVSSDTLIPSLLLPATKRGAISHHSAQIVWINASVNSYHLKGVLAYQRFFSFQLNWENFSLSSICFQSRGPKGSGEL